MKALQSPLARRVLATVKHKVWEGYFFFEGRWYRTVTVPKAGSPAQLAERVGFEPTSRENP